jgi:hypothetical protein
MAFAQPPGSIGVFADPGATNCDIYDTVAGLITTYVVHVFTPGATASQFKLDCTTWNPTGFWTHLGETYAYTSVLGNTQIGVAIAYGACIPGPNLLATVNWFGSGLATPCSFCQIVADPTAVPPGIYVADCADPPNVVTATGGDVVINPVPPDCVCDVPAEETSWGQLKALYK